MSEPDYIYNRGLVNDTSAPTSGTDEDWKGIRVNRRGEQFDQPIGSWRHNLSKDGAYFTAHHTTIDVATTLAGHAAPVLVDGDLTMTKPIFFARNGATSSETKRVYMDYVEIDVTVAGANGTSNHWSAQLDTGATRVTTAGTTFTSCNCNMQSSATPDLAVQGGVVVVGAETANVRRLGSGTFRSTIEIAGDRYVFHFGQESQAMNKVVTAATVHHVNLGPVILGPTDQLAIALFQVAQDTAGIYRIRCGWWER